MKKFLIVTITAFAAIFTSNAVNAQSVKFGKINYMEIANAMPAKDSADRNLKTLADDYTQRLEKINVEYEAVYNKLIALPAGAQSAETDDLSSQLKSLQSRGKEMQQVAENVLAQKQQELYTAIQARISKAVEKVAKASSLSMVVDMTEGVVLYVDPAMTTDITPAVKKELGIK